jgi:Holliday junction DNA helicase RuvA
MIGLLRGKIIETGASEKIIVDVSGVGYEVSVVDRNFDDEVVTLYIRTVVREDNISLFGFKTIEERDLFDLVTGVSSIGPKIGLAILATLSPSRFCEAVVQKDLNSLTTVSGVGKKSAERICLELKDKIKGYHFIENYPADDLIILNNRSDEQEAVLALKSMGYQESESRRAVQHAIAFFHGEPTDVEDLLKKSLEYFYKEGRI